MEGANELKAGGAHRHAVALDDGSILNRYWDGSDVPAAVKATVRYY